MGGCFIGTAGDAEVGGGVGSRGSWIAGAVGAGGDRTVGLREKEKKERSGLLEFAMLRRLMLFSARKSREAKERVEQASRRRSGLVPIGQFISRVLPSTPYWIPTHSRYDVFFFAPIE